MRLFFCRCQILIFFMDDLILKSPQRFRSIKRNINIFTEEVSKIALSDINDKIIKSINAMETYAYETSNMLIC